MVSEEDIKKDAMRCEAVERLKLMKADPQDVRMVLLNGRIDTKVVVDHENKSVRKAGLTEEELQMIRNIEAEYDIFIYYVIRDEGFWPDGCTFTRYTLPYVGKCEDDYEMEREDAIGRCGTCPAYVVNMEDNDCSEITEFVFQNVGGMIINAS